jgi:hypothetical protein
MNEEIVPFHGPFKTRPYKLRKISLDRVPGPPDNQQVKHFSSQTGRSDQQAAFQLFEIFLINLWTIDQDKKPPLRSGKPLNTETQITRAESHSHSRFQCHPSPQRHFQTGGPAFSVLI